MKALIKKLDKEPELIDIPLLEIIGEDQSLIKVDIVGLCRTDLLVASGKIKINEDIILGHEFSGLVVKGSLEWLNKKVAVNPLSLNKKFLGLDVNGALSEYVAIDNINLIEATNVSSKVAAYLEPVAASMAILNANPLKEQKGAIYGKNRIAELSYIIAKNNGLNVTWISEKENIDAHKNKYDYIVETLFTEEDLNKMFEMLKEGGKLIVKSRKKDPVPIDASKLVSKNLILQAVNYYDFKKTMGWLEKNHDLISHLLGQSFNINDWEEAFKAANTSENKKIFISFNN